MRAIPGVASLDILGNLIPFIGGGEEEKIEQETVKILGTDGGRTALGATISAQVNRVAVIDGHTMTVSVELSRALRWTPSSPPCARFAGSRRS